MLTLDRLHRLIGEGLARGAIQHSLTSFEWDVAGDCSASVARELHVQPSPVADSGVNPREMWQRQTGVTVRPRETQVSATLLLHTRCRQCENCLDLRRRQWSARAIAEWRAAPRTWFGTLTLRPEAQYRFLCEASLESEARAVPFGDLSPRDQFLARHKVISREITKYLKRIRKEAGAETLRYMLVAEAHKSGLPHYHLLVNETDPERPVGERTLRKQWPHGYSKFKLILEPRAAVYVCKYLSKDSASRVRASLDYGSCSKELHPGRDSPATTAGSCVEKTSLKRPREGEKRTPPRKGGSL